MIIMARWEYPYHIFHMAHMYSYVKLNFKARLSPYFAKSDFNFLAFYLPKSAQNYFEQYMCSVSFSPNSNDHGSRLTIWAYRENISSTQGLGDLRAPTSSWRLFRPSGLLDYVLCAFGTQAMWPTMGEVERYRLWLWLWLMWKGSRWE